MMPPVPPLPWAPPTTDARRCLLSFASSSCHLTMNRADALRTPRYHSPAFFAAVGHSAVSAPNTKGECSGGPLVARNPLRSSTMHICQVLNCPPGLGFSPSAIVPNITRLCNDSLLCRATAPAKRSRRLRMVVSMFSQRVILRALAYERMVWCGTKSALGVNDSQEDLMVSSSELGKVFRSDGLRHTPVP